MIPVIDTKRLVLRGPNVDDFATYREFFEDVEASRDYGGPLDAGRAWRTLALDIGHWELRKYGRWSVVERETNLMVGSCGLWWPEGWPRAELTWWIMPMARRKGYALEASRAVITFGYRVVGWPIVETHVKDENVAARRLIEKLGGQIIAREGFPDGIERNVYQLSEAGAVGHSGQ